MIASTWNLLDLFVVLSLSSGQMSAQAYSYEVGYMHASHIMLKIATHSER